MRLACHAAKPAEFDSGHSGKGRDVLTSLDRKELKGVVRLAVKEAGGQENCANVSGRIDRAAAFSDYANNELDNRHMPIDVAVEIDQFNANARIVSAMARMLGYELRPIEADPARSDEDALLATAKESTEAVATIWAAKADGIITQAERAEGTKQIDEAIRALHALRARWTREHE